MTGQTLMRADMVPLAVGTAALAWTAAALGAAWAAAGLLMLRKRAGMAKCALVTFPLGTAAAWAALQAAARVVKIATPLGMFEMALAAGAAGAMGWCFYLHEAGIIGKRAWMPVGLRVGAIMLLAGILAEPVLTGMRERTIPRRVVVLADDSASMQTRDAGWTAVEKASIAEALGIAAMSAGAWTNMTEEAAAGFLAKLPEAAATNLAAAAGLTRAELAERIFRHGRGETSGERLAAKYTLDMFRFAATAHEDPLAMKGEARGKEQAGESWRAATDLAGALEAVADKIPVEEIAGIVVFTDGRHNGEAGVEAISRRLGIGGAKIFSVITGSASERKDLAVARLDARESVFVGDKLRATVQLSANGYAGEKAKVRFMRDGETLEEREVEIGEPKWKGEVKFTDEPKERGLYRYRVEVERKEGDACEENDAWNLDVSVSDDRTNVLLVEKRPRWEYRYLRNLFYGRDKSVHLQDLLLEPDRIGDAKRERPAASADRAFGDTEAGAFPADDAEWGKFDVIILGDLSEGDLPAAAGESIWRAVTERGAMLVLLAGPEGMPHGLGRSKVRELVPVEWEKRAEYRTALEAEFRVGLTGAGRGHPVMVQSASAAESEDVWEDLPPFRWRLPLTGVKAGAEVLATALAEGSRVDMGALVNEMAKDPEAAARRIEEMRARESRNALVVAARAGRGKVLMLTTDMTWRLRYRVGDARHHRFWGQALKWGAGERLRGGDAAFRFGTDAVCYTVGEAVKVYARVMGQREPEAGAPTPTAAVIGPDGKRLRTVALKYREGSNGFYEAEMPGPEAAGSYTLDFGGTEFAQRMGEKMPDEASTRFTVVTAKTPAEFTDTASTRETCARMASATGGKVFMPHEYAAADLGLGEGTKTVRDVRENRLWAHPLAFLLAMAMLTAEWILRKRMGLA